MPSKRMAIEWLQHEVSEGRGDEPCHVVDIRREQRERIKNDGPKPKTRFQIELGDADLYREWNVEKERILHRARVKAIGLDIMLKAWQAMDDAWIDKLLAEQEGPPDGS